MYEMDIRYTYNNYNKSIWLTEMFIYYISHIIDYMYTENRFTMGDFHFTGEPNLIFSAWVRFMFFLFFLSLDFESLL